MVVPARIRTTKTFIISLSLILTLKVKLLGIFLPQVTANYHATEWVEQLKKAVQGKFNKNKRKPNTSAKEAYDYCINCMKGVQFFYISKNEFVNVRKSLQERYKGGCTVPGMCSFHVFIPKQIKIIAFKRTAKDEDFWWKTQLFSSVCSFKLTAKANFARLCCCYE